MMCGPECKPEPGCKYWDREHSGSVDLVKGLLTSSGRTVTDAQAIQAFRNLGILHDALDLVAELWPRPGYSTVQLESHQWIKLRRLLLTIPDLLAADE